MADIAFDHGDVWLVGAGPGDPDLLTRKAERLLRRATIVFYDALVGPAILDLVPPDTTLVAVGKRSGRHSKDQPSINALLVRAALDGHRVVRLKGGDPVVFGRMTEEVEALGAHGITVRVCPGITAASAAAASGTISLTLRGSARTLTLVTAHARAGEPLDLDWSLLADRQSTLAVYMGRTAAPEVAASLMEAGLPADTPVMIAVNVSLPDERLIRGRLDSLAFLVRTISDRDPALLLIGETAGTAVRAAPCRENASRRWAPTGRPDSGARQDLR